MEITPEERDYLFPIEHINWKESKQEEKIDGYL